MVKNKKQQGQALLLVIPACRNRTCHFCPRPFWIFTGLPRGWAFHPLKPTPGLLRGKVNFRRLHSSGVGRWGFAPHREPGTLLLSLIYTVSSKTEPWYSIHACICIAMRLHFPPRPISGLSSFSGSSYGWSVSGIRSSCNTTHRIPMLMQPEWLPNDTT